MSYQVLARRWRPRRFDEIVGQEHVTKTLANAIRAGRLAHAFLLCGPRGVGKTTTARVLAKCLNCETASAGPVVDPCNQCTACREIDSGASLDVLEIDGASNRGIDEIRDLRENVRYAPSGGRAKVYIIDEVHMLTKEAFNALLKTLEEPPSGVYFVFATTEAHKVPATIRSRCQRYDFHRIAAPTLVATLARLAEKEKIAADPAALAEIARQADGGLRDAESLLDQAAAVGEGRVTLETIRELLGEAEEGIVLRIAERLAEQDAVGAFTELHGLLEQGLDPQRIALSLTQTFRDLLVARASTGDLEGLGVRPDLVAETRRVAACFTPGKLTALLALAGRTVAELRRSPRPRLALEVALASMARVEDPGAIGELIGRLDAMEQGGEARESQSSTSRVAPAEARVPKSEPPASHTIEETRQAPEVEEPQAEPRAVEGPHGALWGSLLGAVRSRKMMLASFLDHGRPVSIEEDVLLVAFDNSYHEGIVNRRENLDMIHEELHRVAGKAIAFRVKREAPLVRTASERAVTAPVSTRDILGQNPGLGRLLDELGGRLLPGGLGGGS